MIPVSQVVFTEKVLYRIFEVEGGCRYTLDVAARPIIEGLRARKIKVAVLVNTEEGLSRLKNDRILQLLDAGFRIANGYPSVGRALSDLMMSSDFEDRPRQVVIVDGGVEEVGPLAWAVQNSTRGILVHLSKAEIELPSYLKLGDIGICFRLWGVLHELLDDHDDVLRIRALFEEQFVNV